MKLHTAQPLFSSGLSLTDASAAMVLLHGRGATAQSILLLATELAHPAFAYVAPQATHNTWYPYSFLQPIETNEPWLSSALATVGAVIEQVTAAGIPLDRVMIGGFSQGACLAAEFVARHPRRYGGLLLFSGGLIGPPGTPRDDPGTLAGMPVFLGCSDVDAHIPVARVHETTAVLRRMGAVVDERIYPGMEHTIVQDELAAAAALLTTVAA